MGRLPSLLRREMPLLRLTWRTPTLGLEDRRSPTPLPPTPPPPLCSRTSSVRSRASSPPSPVALPPWGLSPPPLQPPSPTELQALTCSSPQTEAVTSSLHQRQRWLQSLRRARRRRVRSRATWRLQEH